MNIILPKIALTMTSGVIQEWYVTIGQTVTKGEVLFTFETDKSAVDVSAPADGVVRSISAAPGDDVVAGTVVAELAVEGEQASRPAPASGGPVGVASAAADLASVLGVDLATVVGSGTGGRILEADVIAAAERHAPPEPPQAAAASAGLDVAPLDFSPARRASWANLERSAAVPTFVLGGSLAISRLKEIRAAGVSLLDVIALAVARTLPDHPTCHGRVRDGRPETFGAPRIGILVRQDDALYTPSYPVEPGDNAASFGRRRREAQAALVQGRLPSANSLAPTFVISNLGHLGVEWFSAMLYPDTAVTMALGAMGAGGHGPNEIAAVLTCDHRLADGVDAARFLAALSEAVNTVPLAGKERA